MYSLNIAAFKVRYRIARNSTDKTEYRVYDVLILGLHGNQGSHQIRAFFGSKIIILHICAGNRFRIDCDEFLFVKNRNNSL